MPPTDPQENIPRYRPTDDAGVTVKPAYRRSAQVKMVGGMAREPLPDTPSFSDITLDDILTVVSTPSTPDLFHFAASTNLVVAANKPVKLKPQRRMYSWMVRNLDPNQTITGWHTDDDVAPNYKYWTVPVSQAIARDTNPKIVTVQPSTAGTTQAFEVEFWYY